MDRRLHHELRPHGVERYRRDAKALLRAVREGDARAGSRARDAIGGRMDERFVLADALHVVAVEHGFRSWPAFKHELEATADDEVRPVGRIGAAPSAAYAGWAERLLSAARAGKADALERLRAGVPRLAQLDDGAIADGATPADAQVCLAREYGFRTWAELADAADRAQETHYSRLPAASPWKRAEAAIRAGDAATLRALLDQHPGLGLEDWGATLLCAAAQPEAGAVPRDVIDTLIEAGSELDVPLNLAACFNKAAMVGWLLDAGADAAAIPIWGITPLQTAVYHGSREAADLLVARTGLLPDALYIAAAAGDLERLRGWFDERGRLRAEALRLRPELSDVGWPPHPPAREDPADAVSEALSLAAQAGRTEACEALLDRGADPARAPLYGITPLHFAVALDRRETIELLLSRSAPRNARDALHDGTPLDWALRRGETDGALLDRLRPE